MVARTESRLQYHVKQFFPDSIFEFNIDPQVVSNFSNFPKKRSGTAEILLKLLYLGEEIYARDALCDLDEMNCRPADIWELLSFAEQYPYEVWNPIIALGSSCLDKYGVASAPYLLMRSTTEYALWLLPKYSWRKESWFAAVPKSSKF